MRVEKLSVSLMKTVGLTLIFSGVLSDVAWSQAGLYTKS